MKTTMLKTFTSKVVSMDIKSRERAKQEGLKKWMRKANSHQLTCNVKDQNYLS